MKCPVLFGNYNRALIFNMYIPCGKRFLNIPKYSYWRKMLDLGNSAYKKPSVCLVEGKASVDLCVQTGNTLCNHRNLEGDIQTIN